VKYLGVDFGLKRIGLAISEGSLASPLKIIEGYGMGDLVDKVVRIAADEKVDQVIVGVPEGKIGEIVKKFTRELKKRGLKVDSADETLSSQNALQSMIEMGIPKKKRSSNDATAAAIILQQFLDSK